MPETIERQAAGSMDGHELSSPYQPHRNFSQNSPEGQNGTMRTSHKTPQRDIGLRDRLHHFTWAWFTLTMSTGGIGLVLANVPHRFTGLDTIGTIVFILDLVLFLFLLTGISARFVMFPVAFKSSLQHPTESLFFATFWISIINIINQIQVYGVPHCGYWLVVVERVLFWAYFACTFLVAVFQYFHLFTGKPLTIQSMTPAWILPVFPVMLVGTMAGILGPSQPPAYALPMFVVGVTSQGLGLMISMFMYAAYIGRLMTSGLPLPNLRPGMFIAVGPPSFTGLAMISITNGLGRIYPAYTTISSISHPEIIADMFRVVALSLAIFLWATGFWFFSLSLVSVLYGAKDGMSFHLVWWAFVFPNVGFTIVTIEIGQALMSEGILWVSTVMTILLVAIWLFVGFMHARAVWKKDILWPGKDEDHDQ